MQLNPISSIRNFSQTLQLDIEKEWQIEYWRLGRIYATWGGVFAIIGSPFGIISESKTVPDNPQLWLFMRLMPLFLISISLIFFRLYKFSPEWMFEIIGLSLFIAFAYRVNCTDWVTTLITSATVLIPAAFLSFTRPAWLAFNFAVFIVANIFFYQYFCNKPVGEYLAERGSVTLLITTIVSSLVAIFRYYNIKNNFVNRLVLKEALNEVEAQKMQSEKLLLSILPEKVAEELKKTGKVTPQLYEEATVLFTDFKGFTIIAEHHSPAEMLRMLEYCFGTFDKICEKYHLEKIKTIGDGYMCAGGIPVPNESHALDAVNAALEMQKFMINYNENPDNQFSLELRIGIHTGPLIAGVIGDKKFAYDIWGNTVNTASRLESSGIERKVNISQTTYELVRDYFDCEYRGMINAKNLGDIKMYLITGKSGK